MANTANQPWTGPTAKDANAGGKTLGKKLTVRGSVGEFSNGTSAIRAALGKMRFQQPSGMTSDVKGVLTKPH